VFLHPFSVNGLGALRYVGCGVDAIAAAIRHCVENPEKIALWKKQARALAERKFNTGAQGTRLRQAVDECLHKLSATTLFSRKDKNEDQ
jgi:hypothetical protein